MHGIAIKTLTPILSFLSSKNPKERMRDNMDLKVHIQERLPKKKKKKEEEEEEEEEEKTYNFSILHHIKKTFSIKITLKHFLNKKKKLKQKHFLNQNKSNPSYNCLLF